MKKDQPPIDDLPQEVKEYYKSERRQKTGVAWLLALGTLLLTLGVAAALFFGGTWLWNTLTNNDEQPADTAQTQPESTDQPAPEQQPAEDSTAAITGSDYSTSTTPEQSTSTSSDQATSSTSTGTTAPTTTDIPAAGDSTSEPETLVNTGPGDESNL